MILSLVLDGRGGLGTLAETARHAERAGMGLLLAGYPPDGLERGVAPADPAALDPLSVASALIGVTRCIGLAAVAPATGWAPFNMARAFSALDNLSAGRAGWFALPGEALAADPQRERFAEHLQVTLALMHSWDADAVVLDKAEAIFTDPAKVHRIAHAGRHFTVDGPLNSPRSPQGRPVLLQAPGLRTELADILVVRPSALNAAPGPGRAGRKLIVDLAFSLTGAEIGPASLAYAGDPGGLVALIQAWGDACDGFNLLPARTPQDTAAFADHVAPALRAAGLLQDPVAGDLRTRLGLWPIEPLAAAS